MLAVGCLMWRASPDYQLALAGNILSASDATSGRGNWKLSSHVSREALTFLQSCKGTLVYEGRVLCTANASAVSSTQRNSSFRVQSHQINCLEHIFKPLPLTNSKFSISSVKSCILNLSHNGVGQPHLELCSVIISVPSDVKISDFPWSLCLW